MAVPLTSGLEWEEDPVGNVHSHDGRTSTRDMRAKTDATKLAIVKRPKTEFPAEIYSVGMERVAYVLAEHLELPVLDTYLEVVDGHASSVQLRVPECRSWIQVGGAPGMRDNVENEDMYPLAALFDVWTANTDRRAVNLIFQALPEGTSPARASGSRLHLIDHGQCGLWPADKFPGRGPDEIPERPEDAPEGLCDAAEVRIAQMMPAAYRMALKRTQGTNRIQLLDRIRSVEDDLIDATVNEVPEDYFTPGQAHATAAFLKGRRNTLDRVVDTYWKP